MGGVIKGVQWGGARASLQGGCTEGVIFSGE